jgi:hypothetical protein
MKKLTAAVMGACLAFSGLTYAGEANVTFDDFKSFRDVQPSNETKGSYHKRVQTQFTKHFEKLAEQLPEGYKLGVKITDIDLAGDVRFGPTEVRIVKNIYFPSIKFEYMLTDNKGKLIEKGNADLKDMGFLDKIKRGRDEEFMHDKRLISDWFEKELLPKAQPAN